MSRTYRRTTQSAKHLGRQWGFLPVRHKKNHNPAEPHFYLFCPYDNEDGELDPWTAKRWGVRSVKQLQERKRAYFHSDRNNSPFFSGLPSYYRKTFRDRARMENKQEIERCLKNGSWDDHVVNPLPDKGQPWWWYL